MDTFRLTKWYLDVVDGEGHSAIAYWSAIEWGPIAVGWQGLSLHLEAGRAVHRSRPGRGAAPSRANGRISWESDALGCRVTCDPWCPAFEQRLLDRPDGRLDWRCEAPGAEAIFEMVDGRVLHGTGYGEVLVLGLPPWRLPITQLRWGRWVSPVTRRSIVWIDWRGAYPLTLVLENGVPQQQPSVDDGEIRFADAALRLDASDTLHARTLADVLGAVPVVARRIPASWRMLEDRKTRSRGTVHTAGAATDAGWAIHELVRWP